ncbi:hypothetical protein EVAR_13476_1 [Eumeta japonica]|uniref:Uncharacterized protein n=1 Tax=Eumeta variegata TaxID=151549 RepID=A0A4C1UZB6_EUMVA|nr:hypothetical protein EVAR_13476_1 [Eumeta japonica]
MHTRSPVASHAVSTRLQRRSGTLAIRHARRDVNKNRGKNKFKSEGARRRNAVRHSPPQTRDDVIRPRRVVVRTPTTDYTEAVDLRARRSSKRAKSSRDKRLERYFYSRKVGRVKGARCDNGRRRDPELLIDTVRKWQSGEEMRILRASDAVLAVRPEFIIRQGSVECCVLIHTDISREFIASRSRSGEGEFLRETVNGHRSTPARMRHPRKNERVRGGRGDAPRNGIVTTSRDARAPVRLATMAGAFVCSN